MLRPFSSLRALIPPAGLFGSFAHHGAPSPWLRSSFTTSVATKLKQMPPRPKHPPESEIEESFLKGSGPGGQKINKTNSAVQLKHIPTNLVIKCQATRSRTQNRKIARDLLALKLDALHNGAASRTAVVSDAKKKKAASKAKKSRRKYRKVDGVDGVEEEGQDGQEELEGEGEREGGIEEVGGREGEQGRGEGEEVKAEEGKQEQGERREGIRDGQVVEEVQATERQDTGNNTKNER